MQAIVIIGIAYLAVAVIALVFILALLRGAGRDPWPDEPNDFDRSMRRWGNLREDRE